MDVRVETAVKRVPRLIGAERRPDVHVARAEHLVQHGVLEWRVMLVCKAHRASVSVYRLVVAVGI